MLYAVQGSLTTHARPVEVTLTIPTPSSEPAPVSDRPPALVSLSDAQLAQQVGQLVEEVQRRLEKDRGNRPELETASAQTRASLDRLAPRPAKHAKSSRSRKTSSALQKGQRKAVRAAFLAGVAPTQVAKHFRLSLATVRKVLDEAE
jgi:DNA-directed RNA polymerase specialized sigma24 family protein